MQPSDLSQPAPISFVSTSLPPHEHLLALARAAFPHRPELKNLQIGVSVSSAWAALVVGTGVPATELAAALGKQIGVPVAKDLVPDIAVARFVPEALARTHLAVPLRILDDLLVVASASPFQGGGLRRIAFVANRQLALHIAPPEEIEVAIATLYQNAAERQSSHLGQLFFENRSDAGAPEPIPDSAIVALGRALIRKSIEAGASDLHAQPHAGGGLVRIRVDGVLRRVAHLPGAVLPVLIRYIKAQGGMDPSTDRVPQDGRLSIMFGEHDFDVRISVLPASRGESLVMRFLDQRRVYRLSNSGFSRSGLHALRRLASNTAGIVLITGPTGSGKTSTLYGMLSEINRVGINIITVENPVEYRIPGIAQVEVNAKAGLTFASTLRSILRQDPNVILIGEIRDQETAEIAVQSALTGHLVLSTLHTNDALTAIPRLLDLGIQPSVLADALVGVVAQRLLRRLCEKCRAPVTEPLLPEERALHEATGELATHRAVGCIACGGTGYAGRMPVIEVAEMNESLHELIAKGNASLDAMRQCVTGPLASIASTAAARVYSGDTTVREAVRVVGQRFWSDLARKHGRPIPAEALRLFQGEGEGAGADPLVLVFDNDDAAAREIGRALEQEHFRSVIANDPSTARALLEREEDVSLLVIDLDPGDGRDSMKLSTELRKAFAWSRLPAVPIVRAGDTELRKSLEDLGVTDYLVKPISPAEIAARVRAAYAR